MYPVYAINIENKSKRRVNDAVIYRYTARTAQVMSTDI